MLVCWFTLFRVDIGVGGFAKMVNVVEEMARKGEAARGKWLIVGDWLWTGESSHVGSFLVLGFREAGRLIFEPGRMGPKFLALAVYESPKFIYTNRSLPTRCV